MLMLRMVHGKCSVNYGDSLKIQDQSILPYALWYNIATHVTMISLP